MENFYPIYYDCQCYSNNFDVNQSNDYFYIDLNVLDD